MAAIGFHFSSLLHCKWGLH